MSGSRRSSPAPGTVSPAWHQRLIRLRPRPRGFHLITRDVAEALPELAELRVGLAHVQLAGGERTDARRSPLTQRARSRLSHHEDVAGRGADHVLRRGAQQCARDVAPPGTAHDE
jgi:hypothetical protein